MRGGVHACSIWLVDSQGLTDINLTILAEAAAMLGAISGPWVIGGDWNINPQVLRASGWLGVVGGRLFSTELTTCNGSTYGVLVVSHNNEYSTRIGHL